MAITGHIENSFENKALDDGINMVVSKPLRYECLKDVLIKCGFLRYDVFSENL